MTERQQGPYGIVANCLRCGVEFAPRRAGHVFHNAACRHAGAREPHERVIVDHEQITRLFDSSRDPDEKVRADDWHPNPDPAWRALDSWDAVRVRRRWYEELVLAGKV
jgi:hypothetical protein